jgi:hypothetical protein
MYAKPKQAAILPILALLAASACSDAPEASDNGAASSAEAPGAPAAEPTAAPAVVRPKLAIDGEGLRLIDPSTGAATPLRFGTDQPTLLAALNDRGAPKLGRLEECGAGPLDQARWPDGLSLYFQDSKFAGWALGQRDAGSAATPLPTTMAGIGIGSTRAELDAAQRPEVMESSLGTEFSAGGLGGVLDGTRRGARVTHLWAGATCIMR